MRARYKCPIARPFSSLRLSPSALSRWSSGLSNPLSARQSRSDSVASSQPFLLPFHHPIIIFLPSSIICDPSATQSRTIDRLILLPRSGQITVLGTPLFPTPALPILACNHPLFFPAPCSPSGLFDLSFCFGSSDLRVRRPMRLFSPNHSLPSYLPLLPVASFDPTPHKPIPFLSLNPIAGYPHTRARDSRGVRGSAGP